MEAKRYSPPSNPWDVSPGNYTRTDGSIVYVGGREQFWTSASEKVSGNQEGAKMRTRGTSLVCQAEEKFEINVEKRRTAEEALKLDKR